MTELDPKSLYKGIYPELYRYILATRKDFEDKDPNEHVSFTLLETYDQFCASSEQAPRKSKKDETKRDAKAEVKPEKVVEKSVKIAKFVNFSEEAKTMLSNFLIMLMNEIRNCNPEVLSKIDLVCKLSTEETQSILKSHNTIRSQELAQLRLMQDKSVQYVLEAVESYIYGEKYSHDMQESTDPQYFESERCAMRFICKIAREHVPEGTTLDKAKDPKLYVSNKIKQTLELTFQDNARIYELTYKLFDRFLKVLGNRICCHIWYSGHPANFNKKEFATFLASAGAPLGLIDELITMIPAKQPKPKPKPKPKEEVAAKTPEPIPEKEKKTGKKRESKKKAKDVVANPKEEKA